MKPLSRSGRRCSWMTKRHSPQQTTDSNSSTDTDKDKDRQAQGACYRCIHTISGVFFHRSFDRPTALPAAPLVLVATSAHRPPSPTRSQLQPLAIRPAQPLFPSLPNPPSHIASHSASRRILLHVALQVVFRTAASWWLVLYRGRG